MAISPCPLRIRLIVVLSRARLLTTRLSDHCHCYCCLCHCCLSACLAGGREGGDKEGLPPLLIVKCPPLMADDCCTTMSSSSNAEDNAQGNIIVAKMHSVRSCYDALTVAVTKKTIGNHQGMLILQALKIANFCKWLPSAALLEINHNIAVMGGVILILSKNWPLFVCCLFFFCYLRARKS